MKAAKILVIEDDSDLGASITENLQLEGYQVDWAQNGKQGLQSALSGIHDLILLDLMLPHIDGMSILKSVREKLETPIMIVSAKNQLEDKLQGLESKADDYLTKPFHLKELLLRIQNLIRRASQKHQVVSTFQINQYSVNIKTHEISCENENIALSKKEAKALSLFYVHKNEFLSREQIMDHVWGINNEPNTRTIDNMILKFRKIFESDPTQPKYFLSKRGLGYCLQIEEENL